MNWIKERSDNILSFTLVWSIGFLVIFSNLLVAWVLNYAGVESAMPELRVASAVIVVASVLISACAGVIIARERIRSRA